MELYEARILNFLKSSRNNKLNWQSFFYKKFSSDAIKKNNLRVYCFGLSEHGALGLQKDATSRVKRYISKPIRHYFGEENSVCDAGTGYGFTAFSVLRNDTSKVYGCGINTDYQIGNHISQKNNPLEILLKPEPINLGIKDPSTKVISLSAGRAHLAVVTDKEGVFLSGSNCYGQCGREILKEDKILGSSIVNNIKRLGDEEVIDVCCGQDHTSFITQNGKVWTCGWSSDGQTGLGHTVSTFTPCLVAGDIKCERIVKIVGNSECVLALNCRGEVFGWGNNEYNQLVEDKVQQINSPRKLDNLSCLGKIVDIAAGGSFAMVLNASGDVFVWGYGILGGGPEVQKSPKPFKLPRTLFGWNSFQPETKVISISCGLSHLAAINNCNHLYMWGRNRHGCLGIGHTRDQYFPYKVADRKSVV